MSNKEEWKDFLRVQKEMREQENGTNMQEFFSHARCDAEFSFGSVEMIESFFERYKGFFSNASH